MLSQSVRGGGLKCAHNGKCHFDIELYLLTPYLLIC